jgi:LuxR family transcriptional regulator, maltose regulon positive regulatory protein
VSSVESAPRVRGQRARTPIVPSAALEPAQLSHGLLERPELLARLDSLCQHQVTIVCAPAGSGKTTLLRSWAANRGGRVAFVTAERESTDGQRLWHAVFDALSEPAAANGRGKRISDGRVDPETLIERINSRFGEEPLVLIIDDLHEIASEQVIAQLERMVAGLPPTVHAILASRRDPRLRLHRVRLAGEVAEIRARELRFSKEETRELMHSAGVILSDEGAEAICRRTEGWAAGVRLAAISLAAHPDPDRFVDEFSGGDRAVAEYLLAEMLERQPPEIQQMLLRTSIVPRLNGSLADRLADRTDAEQVLLDLEDANAFVVSLDHGRTWFRYHQLLADFLRLELRRTLGEELPGLHRRAAGWFTEQGYVLDAARHLLGAGDWPEAASLLADHLVALTLEGKQAEITAVLPSFPSGAASENPDLALTMAAGELVQGRPTEAAAHLAVAEEHLAQTPPQRRGAVQNAIACSRLALSRQRGQFADVIAQLTEMGLIGGTATSERDFDSDMRGVARMNLGVAEMWSGRMEPSERHLSQGAELARRAGRPFLELICLSHLSFASTASSFSSAQERASEAVRLAETHGWDRRATLLPALATLAFTHVSMGDLDEGERWLTRARSAAEQNVDPACGVLLHLAAGMLDAARGEQERALEALQLALECAAQVEGEHVLAPQLSAWLVCTYVRLDRRELAESTLEGLSSALRETGEVQVAAAYCLFSQGDAPGALRVIDSAAPGTWPGELGSAAVERHLVAGLAQLELGHRGDARRSAEAALAAAERDRLMLPFLMTNALGLIEELPPHDTAHRALLIEARELLGGSPNGSVRREWASPAEPLSPSELRVLRYLPTNLTRPEIASELYVSVNTVNTHIRNIYAKLGSRGRSSAVERARGLKLLAADRSR